MTCCGVVTDVGNTSWTTMVGCGCGLVSAVASMLSEKRSELEYVLVVKCGWIRGSVGVWVWICEESSRTRPHRFQVIGAELVLHRCSVLASGGLNKHRDLRQRCQLDRLRSVEAWY